MAPLPKVQQDEPEYWLLISQGDKSAYEKLFKSYYAPLCRYAGSLIKDPDEAEEVVQTVFFNIWNKRESLKGAAPAKAYVYRAVHNETLNRIKHRKVRSQYAEEVRSISPQGHSATLQVLHAKELGRQIDAALEALPKQCGEVFRRNRFGNLKYAEIAAQLGISVKTVEAHMGKAMKLLRVSLKDYLQIVAAIFFMN